MVNSRYFDVLIVYSSSTAASAKQNNIGPNPFASAVGREDYAHSYSYMLKVCADLGLSAAFTTSNDIVGTGRCKRYWTFKNSQWHKNSGEASARIIFDKFAPYDKVQKRLRELFFSNELVLPFNDNMLYQLFYDKLTMSNELASFRIPTVAIIGSGIKEIRLAIKSVKEQLQAHDNAADFGDMMVLKDRFGSGGNRIYKIENDDCKQIQILTKANPAHQFVIQPMLLFAKGYEHKGRKVRADIRLIYSHEKVVQSYVRIARLDDFRCNDHQGATSCYIKMSEIPKRVLLEARKIVQQLPRHDSIYALDFAMSDRGNPYLVEGNTGPGLNWKEENRVDANKSRALIRIIVKELASRVAAVSLRKNKIQTSPVDWALAVAS